MSKHKPKPGTVLVIHADPVRHDSRGTAGTLRMDGDRIVPIAGVRVHDPFGTAPTYDFTCQSCGVNARVPDYALLREVRSRFADDPAARRVEIGIMDLYSY